MAIKLEQVRRSDDSSERERPSLLRRRGRSLAVAAVVVVAAVVGVSLALTGGGSDGEPEATTSEASDVVAHPDQSPPRELIAAGQVAVSAYHTTKLVQQPDGDAVNGREWSLYNAATKRYEKTDWAWLDVAPGMKTAAVLESDLPVERIGLMSLSTGKVQRWIEVDKGVGGVQFSPDGKRLVATTYSDNPDGLFKETPVQVQGSDGKIEERPGPKQSRTGFYVVDVDSGQAEFSERPAKKDSRVAIAGTGRQDFSWSLDGELLWEKKLAESGRNYYDVNGRLKSLPQQKSDLVFPPAVTSPDGKLVTGGFAGGDDGQIVSAVLDAKTGKQSAVVPGQQLLAWADNTHLIAWLCDLSQCKPGNGEFRNQLVLVSLGDDKVTPLSGFRKDEENYVGRWDPVFTRR